MKQHQMITFANSINLKRLAKIFATVAFSLGVPPVAAVSADDSADRIADEIRALSATALPDDMRENASSMVRTYLQQQLKSANERSSNNWRSIDDRAEWEAFSEPIIGKLRKSLGQFPEPPEDLDLRVVGRVKGDGFIIENLVFRSRPGIYVTANLYMPANSAARMPGIVICHSHHRPKEHGELQDMGMTWARAGCVVLVMDQLGHGERRQHGFATSQDFANDFAVSRQDYYFRFDSGIQLHLLGESLIGWMAWDLMRGVDLLSQRDDVDPAKIVLLGAVAGGGDPAAVTAAIDSRIAAAVPFNFGGPQPETRFPLPDDVEATFNYAGSGSWESTRNLRRSAADGFLPWVIVGSIAPRRLIFAHEFNWDRSRDPVWKRLQAIYQMYEAPDRLAYTHGFGELKLRPPAASHCTHIGRYHRRLIHSAFREWFEIDVDTDDEYSERFAESRLQCMTDQVRREVSPRLLHEVLEELARDRLAIARQQRQELSAEDRRKTLRLHLQRVLGDIEVGSDFAVLNSTGSEIAAGIKAERMVIQSEPGILIPIVLLRQNSADTAKSPAVVIFAQAGKDRILNERADQISQLLRQGITVCLPDLRGIGETAAGKDRGRYSADTARAATQLMVGGTTVGGRLKDLRTVLAMLRRDDRIDSKRIAIWGDSLASPNSATATFRMPRRIGSRPRQSEPLGGILALLAGVYEEDLLAICASGGLDSFQSVLESSFVYVPADIVVPELLTVCDVDDIAATIAPRPLRLSRVVDGWNRPVSGKQLRASMPATAGQYQQEKAEERLVFDDERSIADWLVGQLQ